MAKNNEWTQLDNHPRIWVANYKVPNFASRSVVIEFRPNHFCVYSPGTSNLESFSSIYEGKGSLDFIIVPNIYHHLGVNIWKKKFSNAKLIASKKTMTKLEKYNYGEYLDPEYLGSSLPSDITIVEPLGTRFGEIWLTIKNNRNSIWVICDAFFNYTKYSKNISGRILQVIMNASPGLKIGRLIKMFLITNKKKYKSWVLNQIEIDKPDVLIPMHGKIEVDISLSDRLINTIKKNF
jgi:hypothetical protein